MTWAVKYRPKSWSDLVGQEISVTILREVVSRSDITPLFVFSGPRGTGKTTVARILAKAVNCRAPVNGDPCQACDLCQAINNESCPDIMELDAASNGGVAAIRRIKDLALYRPIQATNRVVVLDEAHAMTTEAFQALLKILEEPPPNTMFVMCTTEIHKIPDTIVSRSYPFEFRRILPADIHRRLSQILTAEGQVLSSEILDLISDSVSGGLRDAITLMEQTLLIGNPSLDQVRQLLGTITRSELSSLFRSIFSHKGSEVILWLKKAKDKGTEARAVLSALIRYYLLLLEVSVGLTGDLSQDDYDIARELVQLAGPSLPQLGDLLTSLEPRLRTTLIDPFDLLSLMLFKQTLTR